MIKVLLAEDHIMFRNGLKLILNSYEDLEISGECGNGNEVIRFVGAHEVDLILMDINMPEMNGYETCLKLHQHYPDIKIIALSMFLENSYIMKMLEAGARGYVYKNVSEKHLIRAIKTVMKGDYFVEEDARYLLARFLKWKENVEKGYDKFKDILTEREKEVLKLITEGFTNQEIADKIYVSNRTVDTHRKNILTKLQLKNTASLVRYAVENKYILGIE